VGLVVDAFVVAFDLGRPIFQVRGEDYLRAIDQEEGGKSRGSARGGPKALDNCRQLLEPFSARLV
jgi:hypothetical protein